MPRIDENRRSIIAIDTETTGLDIYHGARPYFVTVCDGEGEVMHWEWDVDPLTRHVKIPKEDAEEIAAIVEAADEIVGQNLKFDAGALREAGIVLDWPWDKCHDTHPAGHLLASNQPHDLTSMCLHYLGKDIKPFEDALEFETFKARRMVQQAKLRSKRADSQDDLKTGEQLRRENRKRRCKEPRSPLADWAIAEKNRADMPSAKEKTWKYDCWLPRLLAGKSGLRDPNDECIHSWDSEGVCQNCDGHRWWTVLRDYSNADSSHTLLLWFRMRDELVKRGLWKLYQEKMRNLPVIAEMEERGAGLRMHALVDLKREYGKEMEEAKATCLGIAKKRGVNLVLPKGSANNRSLTDFAFGVLKLPPIKWTGTGAPSLDKGVIDEYKKILDGDPLRFVKSLSAGKKRAKSVEFLNTYVRFGLPARKDIWVIHPSVNPSATDTTRFSMSNPNLQQVSKEESQCDDCLGEGCDTCGGTGEDLHSVRRCFGPGPGREWWSMDAKNIELRLPAYESGEKSLIALFERPNDPPFYGSQHLLNCSMVYDDVWRDELRAVGLEKVGPHFKKKYNTTLYHYGKCGGLAMQYQCGEGTADRTFRRKGGYNRIKASLVALEKLNAKCVDFANRNGYVETIPDRSIDPDHGYPLLCTRNEWGRIKPTVPLNYRTQGTAGWWMMRALNRCHAKIKEWREKGFDAWIALTVHDELVFDFPKRADPIKDPMRSNLWRAQALRRLMEKGGEDVGVPTPVSMEYHAVSWDKGVSV